MTEAEQKHLYESVGNQIRNLRKKSGFSQIDLADRLQLSRASIVNIEKGRQNPSLHLLIDLSRIFNVRIESFLTKETWKGGERKMLNKIKKEIKRSSKTSNNPIETEKILDFFHKVKS